MFVTAVVHEGPAPSAPASMGGCVVPGTLTWAVVSVSLSMFVTLGIYISLRAS